MDSTGDIMTADLALDEAGRDLWEPALPHLASALAGDARAFLDALEAVARGAGLTQQVPVKTLLDAYSEGAALVRAKILEGGDAEAEAAADAARDRARRAHARSPPATPEGLGETVERLRRMAAEASPVDGDTGAMKPGELDERLSLEVERCQRMDLSLGLVELALDEPRGAAGDGDGRPGRRCPAGDRRTVCARTCAVTTASGSRRTEPSCWCSPTSAAAALPEPPSGCAASWTSAPAAESRRRSPSRWRTTISSTSTRMRCSAVAAAARRAPRSPGLHQPHRLGADRQSVTGRPSASAARRTISRSLG